MSQPLAPQEIDQVWQRLVALVMATRGPWRRQVSEVTGLSFSRVRALRRLSRAPLTLGELAEEMGIDAPAATVLANDLEARGLVQRQVHPENRRCKLVRLTEAGEQTLGRLAGIADPAPALLRELPPELLAALRERLEAAGGAEP